MTLRPWTSGPTPSTFRHELQVQPDVHGPYEAPKTAADVADASDAGVGVPDVLEAGNFTQKLVQTSPAPRPTSWGPWRPLGATEASESGVTQLDFLTSEGKNTTHFSICFQECKHSESTKGTWVRLFKPGLSQLRVD